MEYRQIPFILSPSKVPSLIVTQRRNPYGPVPISIFASSFASSRYRCLNSMFGIPAVIMAINTFQEQNRRNVFCVSRVIVLCPGEVCSKVRDVVRLRGSSGRYYRAG